MTQKRILPNSARLLTYPRFLFKMIGLSLHTEHTDLNRLYHSMQQSCQLLHCFQMQAIRISKRSDKKIDLK